MPTLETKEFKVAPLTLDALSGTGYGGTKGFPSKFYELDTYDDIIIPGAYKKTIPRFLERGFIAHSHNWEMAEVVGYPTLAEERGDVGLYSEGDFHSTEPAQDCRKIATERLQAGKFVGLSIGFYTRASVDVRADAYGDILPNYIPADKLALLMPEIQTRPWVRLVTEIELFEYSIVTMPAMQSAGIVGVRGAIDALHLKDHLRLATDVTGDLPRRLAARLDLLTREGRRFSGATIAQLKEMHQNADDACTHMGGMRDKLAAIIAEAERPEDEGRQVDMTAQRARLMRLENDLRLQQLVH